MQISEGHAMAERVSGAVRGLDQQRSRVQDTLSLVEEVIELKGCAQVHTHLGTIDVKTVSGT